MDQRRFLSGGFQSLVSTNKELILLVCIRDAVRAGVVGHRKVLEQAGHLQAGQGAGGQHLPDGGIKIGAQGKADAAHAGVGFQVDLHPAPGGLCGLAQGLCLRQRVAGRRDVAADQIGRIFGLNVPQDEDGQRLPGPPQLQRLGQTADGQPGRALLGKHAGTRNGTVAVAVGLDHGA